MVLYVVCFDISKPVEDQVEQISYWLEFLSSALPFPPNTADSKWSILLAGNSLRIYYRKICLSISGLKADLQHSSTSWQLGPTTSNLSAWQRAWPNLPIFNKVCIASSKTSRESVKLLLQAIEVECNRILDSFAVQIPTSYRAVLYDIQSQSRPGSKALVPLKELFLKHSCGVDEPTFMQAVQYLHAIGRVVLLKSDLVCTDPTMVPKIAAKFVCPEQVRLNLLNFDVPVLTIAEIGCLMDIDTQNNNRCECISLVTSFSPNEKGCLKNSV